MDQPLILAIDTSSPHASLAISRGEQLLVSLVVTDGQPHSRTLFRHLELALAASSLDLPSIDLFAVATGPGSFTGLRVGLAAVQGLLDASRSPGLGVDVLDLVALAGDGESLRLITLQAGRGEVYCGLREVGTGELPVRIGDDLVGPAAEVVARVRARVGDRPVSLVSDGEVEDSWAGSAHIIRIDRSVLNLAGILARFALRYQEKRGAAAPRACYIRPSDAEGKVL